jgi:signal transduction histidine kinase
MTASARPPRLPGILRSWVLPVVLGAAAAAEAALNPAVAEGSGLPVVFAAAMALPLVRRDRQPLGALAGTLGVFAVQEVWGAGTLSEAVLPFVVLIVAMYSAASRLRGAVLAVAVAISSLAIGGTIVYDGGLDTGSLVYALIVVAAAFTTGRLVGLRTREAGRLTAEKDRLVREQEERERAAMARERMRIAQELHDLITHRVSAMVLQASTERHIIDRDTARLDSASLATTLESIESLGREAMSELRQLLGALFHEGEEPRSPQPGTQDLPALVESSSGAGVLVTLETRGEQRRLPEPLEVSLYRLAQEALTNAMRHAPGSRVRVTLTYEANAVELTVANTAGGPSGSRDKGLGLGVPGMRERARQFGGTLIAGPTPDSGFQVRAHLPVEEESAS